MGDGASDDTKALQAALDEAGTRGGGHVFFPAGTYRVSRGLRPYFLRIYPRTTLTGAGSEVSILKPVDNAGQWADFLRPVPVSTDLVELSISDVGFDMNTISDPIVGDPVATGMGRCVVRSAGGAAPHLSVVRCRFDDCSGVNTLYLAGGRVEVRDCEFTSTGAQSRANWDHSSIYAVARRGGHLIVEGNAFRGTLGSGTSRTAIETHGGSQRVTGNRIADYMVGMNITGVADVLTRGVEVSTNEIASALVAIQIWSWPIAPVQRGTAALHDLRVTNNTATIDNDGWRTSTAAKGGYAAGILLNIDNATPVSAVIVRGNSFRYLASRSSAHTNDRLAAGLSLTSRGEVQDLLIEDNTVVNPLSAGFLLDSKVARAVIRNNHVRNPASTVTESLPPSMRSLLALGGRVQGLTVEGNVVTDTRTPSVVHQIVGRLAGLRESGTIVRGNTAVLSGGARVPELT